MPADRYRRVQQACVGAAAEIQDRTRISRHIQKILPRTARKHVPDGRGRRTLQRGISIADGQVEHATLQLGKRGLESVGRRALEQDVEGSHVSLLYGSSHASLRRRATGHRALVHQHATSLHRHVPGASPQS